MRLAGHFSHGTPLILTEDFDDCLLANTEVLPETGHDQFHALIFKLFSNHPRIGRYSALATSTPTNKYLNQSLRDGQCTHILNVCH